MHGIYDPDGWDRSNYHYSFNIEEITANEFRDKLVWSTCDWSMLPDHQILDDKVYFIEVLLHLNAMGILDVSEFDDFVIGLKKYAEKIVEWPLDKVAEYLYYFTISLRSDK